MHESKIINLRFYAYITRDLEPATLEREEGQVDEVDVGFPQLRTTRRPGTLVPQE